MPKKPMSRHGRSARRLCSALVIATPLVMALYWFGSSGPSLGAAWISDPLFHAAISPAQRIAAAATSLIGLAPALWALVRARTLAILFEHQAHFTTSGVAAAGALTRSLFWFSAGQSLTQTLVPLALTWGNATGQRILAFSLDGSAVTALALGVIVSLLARALDQGRALVEDAALTV